MCIEDITEAFRPCYGPGFSSVSLTHLRSEAGLDVGLDSGETEKATLVGLGCRMGVERLPSMCTVSSKFSSSTKEKSFEWSDGGRGGLTVCSLERAESCQVSQCRAFQGQRLLSSQGDPEVFVSPMVVGNQRTSKQKDVQQTSSQWPLDSRLFSLYIRLSVQLG